MSDLPFSPQNLQDLLNGRVSPEYDWNVVQVPGTSDKMVRLRTIEEALEEFDDEVGAEILQQYIIQIKTRRSAPRTPAAAAPKPVNEQVYLANGGLNVEFLLQNAELLLSSGDYPLARNIYTRVAKAGQSGTKTAEALMGMARCFELENQLDEARAKYEESIAYHPTLETYQYLSTLLSHQEKPFQAAEALERALHLKNLSSKIRYELCKAAGNSWMRAGEMASAEKSYKKALEVDPSADEIQANLGALYLHAEKLIEAKRRFQDAFAANPKNDKALAGLGSCLLASGDVRGAHDLFAQALAINLQNSQAIFHLVKCAYEIKSYATAARIVEDYVQTSPININLLYSLAGLQFHLGRMMDSRTTCEKILELQPEHSGAKELLGMMEQF
jgi:tetratricopeptide (TPR) repeat protein